MANLPDRKDDQPRVDHGGQSGHFYLAESGHFYLGITLSAPVKNVLSFSQIEMSCVDVQRDQFVVFFSSYLLACFGSTMYPVEVRMRS
jgi:hypothetical protein